jgi:hypothetical protein
LPCWLTVLLWEFLCRFVWESLSGKVFFTVFSCFSLKSGAFQRTLVCHIAFCIIVLCIKFA